MANLRVVVRPTPKGKKTVLLEGGEGVRHHVGERVVKVYPTAAKQHMKLRNK